jgi:hypothetical protein
MTLNVISSLLSTIKKDYELMPGTYTINWFARSVNAQNESISDWAEGESFELSIKDTGTGFDRIQNDQLQGRKVFIDGKLFILRGEQMFDAQGKKVW